jgi:hypothetical protein
MLCLIVKHLLLPDSYGPFDRAVEVLVLAAITFEIVRSLLRQRKKKRRLAALHALIAKGKKVVANAPQGFGNSTDQSIAAWRTVYAAWEEEANGFLLKTCWPHASALFTEQDANPPAYMAIAIPIQREYAHLVSGLEILKGIMENPEGYF